MIFFNVYGATGEGSRCVAYISALTDRRCSCWFVPDAFIARTISFYAPVLAVFCVNIVVFAWNWRDNTREEHSEDLGFYFVSFGIVWGLAMLNTSACAVGVHRQRLTICS